MSELILQGHSSRERTLTKVMLIVIACAASIGPPEAIRANIHPRFFGFQHDSETNLHLQVFFTSIPCSADIMTEGFVDDSSGREERLPRNTPCVWVRVLPLCPDWLMLRSAIDNTRDTVILLA